MRYRVLPYRQGSKGAKALAEALGGKVLLLEGSKFTPKSDNDVVINWGATQSASQTMPNWNALNNGFTLLNNWLDIRAASNKLQFFQLMRNAGHDNITPRWWATQEEIPDDAFPIVCRTELAGHSGAGIVIANTRDELVPAPLYTQYIKKEQEYRIHVGKSYVTLPDHDREPLSLEEQYVTIAVQRKARSHNVPDHLVNWQVRSHANGFVFVREGVSPPAAVLDAARLALGASGLDFGAIDVIWNSHQERAYVLEINTAPGLEGQTIEDYASFFRAI